jgi:isocitrate dehydrogenase
MAENEEKIVDELSSVQGPAMDVGGYYKLDAAKASAAMRPSATLNAIVAAV